MKVKDLIEKLQKLDGGSDVFGYSEDENIQRPGHMFRLFDFASPELSRVIRSRDDDGVVGVQFDNEKGLPIVLITLTSDF